MCIIKRLGISATYRRYKFFNDNLFVPLEWNAGVLEIKAENNPFYLNCKKTP